MNENTSLAGMCDTLQQHRPAVRLVSALFKLTRAGERSVEVERLAAVVGRPVEDTVGQPHFPLDEFFDQWRRQLAPADGRLPGLDSVPRYGV